MHAWFATEEQNAINCCIDMNGKFRSLFNATVRYSCYQSDNSGMHLRLVNLIWNTVWGGEINQPLHVELSEERMYPLLHWQWKLPFMLMHSWDSCYQLQIGIHLRLENIWYEIQYGEVKLTNHCMLSCLRKECIQLLLDSGNFRLCWCKVESSCYQLQLGIHLRLENLIWNTVWGGQINQPLHAWIVWGKNVSTVALTERKLPFVLMQSWDTVVISWQLGIHLRLENIWYEIQYGEVKLTNHCMLNCLRKECIHCCIDTKTSVLLMHQLRQLLSVAT